MELVAVIDVGTTRTKAALVDEKGGVRAFHEVPTPGREPGDPDWAVDPQGLHDAVLLLLGRLRQRAEGRGAVEALCVTGQRCTFFARDGEGGDLAALSWADPRASQDIASFSQELDSEEYQRITGVPLSPISVLVRMRWLHRCRPEIARTTRRVALVADRVLEILGASEGYTDPSNASATGLWDLAKGQWCDALCGLARLEASQLPRVVPAGTQVGALGERAARASGFRAGTPLVVGGGDQALASLGMGVLEAGQVGLSLGTSADLTTPLRGTAELVPGRICTAHVLPGHRLVEGFVSSFGAALDWAQVPFCAGGSGPESFRDPAAEDDPLFLPFLSGIATPDFAPEVRGALVGLAPGHGASAIRRAIREGLAMELRRVLESPAFPGGAGTLIACGAPARDPALVGGIATMTGRSLLSYPELEATLLGTAALAWCGVGRFLDPDEAVRAMLPGSSVRHDPELRSALAERRYAVYGRWVRRLLEER